MSIDAIVADVTIEEGETFLLLEPRERGGVAGQTKMHVKNPTPHMSGWIGRVIWGNASVIMWCDRQVAKRVGYCSIELI